MRCSQIQMKAAAWCLQTEDSRRPSMSMAVKFHHLRYLGRGDGQGNLHEDGIKLQSQFFFWIIEFLFQLPRESGILLQCLKVGETPKNQQLTSN
ncbi:Uncharacterized protein TCM_014425 [Theobroma cacao]|uniref:Uncharacterized protein n=1 Tax=Theobroma cacao TaxID=3641 RepID=A0A061FY92_THECC|nr:Uncharacterized protein TCM_014425 [Theobroma cacao]